MNKENVEEVLNLKSKIDTYLIFVNTVILAVTAGIGFILNTDGSAFSIAMTMMIAIVGMMNIAYVKGLNRILLELVKITK
jgi:hypothetical protein